LEQALDEMNLSKAQAKNSKGGGSKLSDAIYSYEPQNVMLWNMKLLAILVTNDWFIQVENSRFKLKMKRMAEAIKAGGGTAESMDTAATTEVSDLLNDLDYDDIGRDFILVGGSAVFLSLHLIGSVLTWRLTFLVLFHLNVASSRCKPD
jgi:hypothetical protein